jgi:hypothetical protein
MSSAVAAGQAAARSRDDHLPRDVRRCRFSVASASERHGRAQQKMANAAIALWCCAIPWCQPDTENVSATKGGADTLVSTHPQAKMRIHASHVEASEAAACIRCSSSAIAGERGLDRETYTLQYDFGTATDLTVEPRWQSVPPDLATILKHIASHLVIGKSTFANIGEEWAPGDAVEVNLPQAQHLFSAYSDKVAASIFLLGGSEVRVYGVLSRRRAQSFCIFKLPYLDLSSLRMSIVQYELRPDRDQTVSTIPRCQPQSLSRSLELPSDR